MCMLSCFISEIHSIICEQYAKCKCCWEKYTTKSILQSYQHRYTTCQSAVKWRKSSRSEDMTCIYTLISDNINNHFNNLDNTPNSDYDKNRIHMYPLSKKEFESVYGVLYHQKHEIWNKSLSMYWKNHKIQIQNRLK